MKKCLLLFFLASFCFLFNVNAQIKKGAVLLGGDLGGSIERSSVSDSLVLSVKNLNASFSYGKAIRENLILGGFVYWMTNRQDNRSDHSLSRSNAFGLGMLLRKYKQLGKSGFSIFAHGALSGEFNRKKTSWSQGAASTNTGWSTALAAYPGLSFALSKKLQVETGFNNFLQLNYSSSRDRLDGADGDKHNSLSFSSSIDNLSSLYLGFRLLLN